MLDDSCVVVYVARHGQTFLNAASKFRGNKNPDIDKTGIAQAHTLAKLFENIDVCAIVCSDKLRATHTAEIIAAKKGMGVHATPSLRALDVGQFSGLDRNKENTDALEGYIQNPEVLIPGGESLANFQRRIRPCIDEAVQYAEEAGKPVLIIGHSSIVHEVSSFLHNNHKQGLVEPGGVVALYVRDGKLTSEPIFKPVPGEPSGQADTVS